MIHDAISQIDLAPRAIRTARAVRRTLPKSNPAHKPLSIFLFGDLRIVRGDGMITTLSSGREQSLLAYLVLHA